MRRFVVVGHTQSTGAPIPLNDPSGAGGRWDVLARCVTSALLVSHGVRWDAEVVLVLRSGPKPRSLRVSGAEIRNLNPDERSTLALLSKALAVESVGAHEEAALPGIHVSHRDLDAVLEEARRGGPLVWLDEAGEDAESSFRPTENVTFVLSDHRPFDPDERQWLERTQASRLRLGPKVLQADQCIVVAHNLWDRLLERA